MDTICRERRDRRFCSTYKYHILFVLAVNVAGFPPDINKEKIIDRYCEKIVKSFADRKVLIKKVDDSVNMFQEIIESWVCMKGESYYHGVKSNQDFNDFLLEYLHRNISKESISESEYNVKEYRGTVIKILLDKKNNYYGFISRMPDNIFFHVKDNANIVFSELYAKDVMYKIKKDYKGNERAIVTRVLKK